MLFKEILRKYYSVVWIFFVGLTLIHAQESKIDSISINARLNESLNEMQVEQKFKLATKNDTLFFHAWINAYSKKNTVLSNSKLEERNLTLHYAKPQERGGLNDLAFFSSNGEKLDFQIVENEKIQVFSKNNAEFDEITARYHLKIPDNSFTGYGVDKDKNYYLNYFFLQPMTFSANKHFFQPFVGMETELSNPTHYSIEFDGIENKHFISYLPLDNSKFNGFSNTIPEIDILNEPSKEFTIEDKTIQFAYPFEETQYTKDILKNQLQFLAFYLGDLPGNKLIITKKIKDSNSFFGLESIKISTKNIIEPFPNQQVEAIKLFEQICYAYLNQVLHTNRQKDFWIKGGLQTYLSINYIETAFDTIPKLTGSISDKIGIFGLKPLKSIYLFNLPLTERYNLMYSFLSRNGNDQVLSTPFEKLNKFNQDYVGNHRTGVIFRTMQEYLGEKSFVELLNQLIKENKENLMTGEKFTAFFEKNSTKPMAWFRKNFVEQDQNIDFRIKKVKTAGDSILIKIKNRSHYEGPFKLTTYNGHEKLFSDWYFSENKGINKIIVKKNEAKSVSVNLDSYFPEPFDQDNYKKIGGFFNNSKNIKFTVVKGIEDPRYRQIVLVPKVGWNNQDQALLTLGFTNAVFLPKEITYRINPTYSTGTGKLVGNIGLGYFSKWKTGLVDKFSFNTNYSYFNYTNQYSAQSFGATSGILFRRKDPREAEFNSASIGFQTIQREISPFPTPKDLDYKNYQLFDLGYQYANNGLIHDFSGGVNFEFSNLFNKIYSEIYYRFRISKNNRINCRLYSGYFLSNESNSNSFDFGISRVNDYRFRYQIFDRVNTQGFFSQQYILADAGFKSFINKTTNEWLMSNNFHFNLTNRIGVFSDFALLKNKNQEAEFIYDSGFSLTAVEDFLELYFPVQSSLGFEPSFKNYETRIRFVVTLSLNTVLGYWRRGKY